MPFREQLKVIASIKILAIKRKTQYSHTRYFSNELKAETRSKTSLTIHSSKLGKQSITCPSS